MATGLAINCFQIYKINAHVANLQLLSSEFVHYEIPKSEINGYQI